MTAILLKYSCHGIYLIKSSVNQIKNLRIIKLLLNHSVQTHRRANYLNDSQVDISDYLPEDPYHRYEFKPIKILDYFS